MKLNYVKVGDYLLPNLTIERQNNEEINKYGYLRLHYLKANNKVLYTTLLLKNELTNHLVSVSIEAQNKIEWVKRMNNYKNMAEEVILNELIYTENV